MSSADTQFSKARLEMLCDGVFAIAMTLLVLELKPPDLPRQTMLALAMTQGLIALASKRVAARR